MQGNCRNNFSFLNAEVYWSPPCRPPETQGLTLFRVYYLIYLRCYNVKTFPLPQVARAIAVILNSVIIVLFGS